MRPNRNISLWLLLPMVCCAAQRQTAPTPETAPPEVAAKAEPEPVRISLLVEAWGRDGVRIVEPGETLRSGDRMALQVELDQAAYVYALYADTTGAVHRLFPKEGDVLLQPGRRRVPPLGQWLRLDDRTGLENLFVVAQSTRLSTAELESRVQAQLAADPPAAPVQPARPNKTRRPRPGASHRRPVKSLPTDKDHPPPSLLVDMDSTVTRDIALDQGTSAHFDGRGAIVRFSFVHK